MSESSRCFFRVSAFLFVFCFVLLGGRNARAPPSLYLCIYRDVVLIDGGIGGAAPDFDDLIPSHRGCFLQDKYGYEQDLMTYLMDLVVTCDRRVSEQAPRAPCMPWSAH